MRNKDLKLVVDLFKFYIVQITKDESYRTRLTDNKEKVILDFIEEIKKETNSTFLSEEYCRTFVEYQFNVKYKSSGQFGRSYKNGVGAKSIQIEWIFGKAAIKRWRDRTDKQKAKTDYIIRKGLKKEVEIKEFKREVNKERDELVEHLQNVNDIEEFEKERFLNSTKGFVNCQINTTLYNHKSTSCSVCKYSVKCKALLKSYFSKVYKARNY